jgi:hypothetical protein
MSSLDDSPLKLETDPSDSGTGQEQDDSQYDAEKVDSTLEPGDVLMDDDKQEPQADEPVPAVSTEEVMEDLFGEENEEEVPKTDGYAHILVEVTIQQASLTSPQDYHAYFLRGK